jgi:hypothetical protein
MKKQCFGFGFPFQSLKSLATGLLASLILFHSSAIAQEAEAPIDVVLNQGVNYSSAEVLEQVKTHVTDLDQYLSIKAQVVSNHPGVVDSILVYLKDKDGKLTWKSIRVDLLHSAREWVAETIPSSKADKNLASTTTVFCPDESVQFLSVTQRELMWDQSSVKEVAEAAEQAGLKTVVLAGEDAMRQNYLNFMSCPALVGNFYDGDANPSRIEASDAPITADDFSTVLKGAFRNHVINVWVACKAFNEPMLSAVVRDAQAQKFVAGKVDLIGIFSDRTGVCTMKETLQGKDFTDSFKECKAQYDLKFHNKWGVGGDGSETLGK